MKHFEEYLNHKYDPIAQMAALLTEAEEELNKKTITRSEFNEIAQNILEFAKIDELTTTVDEKVFLKEAIDALQWIVEHIPT